MRQAQRLVGFHAQESVDFCALELIGFQLVKLFRGELCFFGSGFGARVFFDWLFLPYKVNSAFRNTVWEPELR